MQRDKIWPLKDLNQYLQAIFLDDPNLNDIWVQGEITGLHFHKPSGHLYFCLREGNQTLACAWFRADLDSCEFELADGLKVNARGIVTIYPNKSQYQLKVAQIRPAGIGTLYQAFENLKLKLDGEGLFDEAHKKGLPRFVKTIGLVTSPVGAARRDVEDNLRLRYPLARLIVSGAQVQGEGAGSSIVTALDALLALPDIDVVIICRGGGSFEDLYPFNDETLARRIYGAKIPIITGIGHQKDFTIADFVADVRAGTPSHAVELITPDIADLTQQVFSHKGAMTRRVRDTIERKRYQLTNAQRASFFNKAETYIARHLQELDDLVKKMADTMASRVEKAKTRIRHIRQSLALLDPQSIVDRGFAICYDSRDGVITEVGLIEENEDLKVRLRDGILLTVVTGKERND